jgi:hypothetical protein
MQDDDGQRRPSGAARYLTEDLDLRCHSDSSAPTACFEWRVEFSRQCSARPIELFAIDSLIFKATVGWSNFIARIADESEVPGLLTLIRTLDKRCSDCERAISRRSDSETN